MAKVENRKMIKGWTPMNKKWNNMGVPRNKLKSNAGPKEDQAMKRTKDVWPR